MKIFSAAQIKKWDAFTIANEPITAIELMERAATACSHWLLQHTSHHHHFHIFCGKGNNGGDGLAIARLLIQNQCKVKTYIPGIEHEGSPEFEANLERLHHWSNEIHIISSTDIFPSLHDSDVIIDALFGTGLNKPLEGIYAAWVGHINRVNTPVISIDLPSGLFADESAAGNPIINATHTLSFQNYKLAFLLPENEAVPIVNKHNAMPPKNNLIILI